MGFLATGQTSVRIRDRAPCSRMLICVAVALASGSCAPFHTPHYTCDHGDIAELVRDGLERVAREENFYERPDSVNVYVDLAESIAAVSKPFGIRASGVDLHRATPRFPHIVEALHRQLTCTSDASSSCRASVTGRLVGIGIALRTKPDTLEMAVDSWLATPGRTPHLEARHVKYACSANHGWTFASMSARWYIDGMDR